MTDFRRNLVSNDRLCVFAPTLESIPTYATCPLTEQGACLPVCACEHVRACHAISTSNFSRGEKNETVEVFV